jgi:hypothetical protein
MKSAIGIFAGLGLLIAVLSVQRPSVEVQEQHVIQQLGAITQSEFDAKEELRQRVEEEACIRAAELHSYFHPAATDCTPALASAEVTCLAAD